MGLQLWSLNQRRALCHAEGTLLPSERRNLGRSPRERQSRRSTPIEQLWLLLSRWACHPSSTPPQHHLDSQGLRANEVATLLLSEVTTKKAFFSYYSDLQICNFRDLGNVHPDTSIFPCRKTEAQGTKWEVHNHRAQSENHGAPKKQSGALSTIVRGHPLSRWLRIIQDCRKSFTQRNHEIAGTLNWWHSVI